MILCDELYFEITVSGTRPEIKKLVSFLESGEMDEFFEFSREFISYDDDFYTVGENEQTSITLSNDDFGIEIDEFDTDEFLEVLCKAAKALDVRGNLYDIDDEEYSFISEKGDSYYLNAKRTSLFNDELDEKAREEDMYDDD